MKDDKNSGADKIVGSTDWLGAADWDDVADLLEQFASQCEIAYGDHSIRSKKWLAKNLRRQALRSQKKGT